MSKSSNTMNKPHTPYEQTPQHSGKNSQHSRINYQQVGAKLAQALKEIPIDISWFEDDITFCMSDCNNIYCYRHPSHCRHPQWPHSMANFMGTGDCPLGKASHYGYEDTTNK